MIGRSTRDASSRKQQGQMCSKRLGTLSQWQDSHCAVLLKEFGSTALATPRPSPFPRTANSQPYAQQARLRPSSNCLQCLFGIAWWQKNGSEL